MRLCQFCMAEMILSAHASDAKVTLDLPFAEYPIGLPVLLDEAGLEFTEDVGGDVAEDGTDLVDEDVDGILAGTRTVDGDGSILS